ncbi:MAG: DUF4159 domain-containing protein [Sedimentisphaerales bacterium]|nr:DUF4159 domain-containing protein [Sedimentisphaerales bacterium]
MKKNRLVFFLIILLVLASGGVLARMSSGRGGFGGGRGGRGGSGFTTQRGISQGRQRLPNQQFLNSRQSDSLFQWDVDPEFPQDFFTFVRIDYDYTDHSMGSSGRTSYGRVGRGGSMGGGRSRIDYPDSDNNFSYRLHQLTSIEVNPEPVYITLQDPSLFEYPFIYMLETGSMRLLENDVKTLREYLLNGGFLMIDDFWRPDAWANVRNEMRRVFPDREPVLLTLEHPIFHCVFELKELPQIPAWDIAVNRSTDTLTGVTSESGDPPRYYGIYDDKGRMMVIICRDTDLGDGWEREGQSHTFFKEFSEKKAYPLGINIVFYAMTH